MDRDPSRLGQLDDDRRCGGLSEPQASQHDALIGVAPSGGIRTRYISICHDQAESLTDAASGTLRRNGLGAIAL